MANHEDLLDIGREILHKMVAVDKNVTIYPPNHPAVMEPANEMCKLLRVLLARNPSVSFNIVKSEIYVEKQLLSEESIQQTDFIQLLMEHGVNSLKFEKGVTPGAVASFFSLINDKKEHAGAPEKILKTRLKSEGIVGIDIERLVALHSAGGSYQLAEQEENDMTAHASYEQAMEQMGFVEKDVLANHPINVGGLRSVISLLMEEFIADRDAVVSIMSLKNYDEHLFHHSINVAVTCLLIANRLSLPEELTRIAGLAGLLHDIGKLKVSHEIVNKPGKLSEGEWAIMRRHPIEGAQILMRCESLGDLPVLAALEHHAGYDLSGYPTLKGKSRPHMLARIVCIADVYEALTANRSYRVGRNVQKAVDILIEGIGKQFDPMLVKALLNTIGVFPPGSLIRLETGQTAVVVEPNEGNPFLPKVLTIDEAGGGQDGILIDTSKDPTRYAVTGIAESASI